MLTGWSWLELPFQALFKMAASEKMPKTTTKNMAISLSQLIIILELQCLCLRLCFWACFEPLIENRKGQYPRSPPIGILGWTSFSRHFSKWRSWRIVEIKNWESQLIIIKHLQYWCLNICLWRGAKHDGMCFKQLIQHKKGQNARWMPILPEIYHLSERILCYNINV